MLRKLPYPYKSMLAICSDLDETPDLTTYIESTRYLNTTEQTCMGRGLGLEVGNTIYFDMPNDQFSYWNTDDNGREKVRALIKSGHIDCIHSFGDFASTRKHAERALDDLIKHNCIIETWIDHATAPSNLGSDIMQGMGDLPESEVYHADLTCAFGIKYVWQGRVTSILGQDIPRSFTGLANFHHPISSAKTIGKEFVKGLLGRFYNNKYKMHSSNEILSRINLRDGQRAWNFLRCNPYWGGVSLCENANGIPHVLTQKTLKKLVKKRGICILYTHLGKVDDPRKPFNPATQNTFRLLAEFSCNKDILVTTTRRLLGYCHLQKDLKLTTTHNGDHTDFNITTSLAGNDLCGLTIYTERLGQNRLFVNGKQINNITINPEDESNKASISIPWKKLIFPDITNS